MSCNFSFANFDDIFNQLNNINRHEFGRVKVRCEVAPGEIILPKSSKVFKWEVKVSSDYDSSKGLRKIKGTGSVIRIRDKYFVITVDHLASGKNLEIENYKGEKLKIINMISNANDDIALIEVSKSDFAVFGKL